VKRLADLGHERRPAQAPGESDHSPVHKAVWYLLMARVVNGSTLRAELIRAGVTGEKLKEMETKLFLRSEK
jgi:hypothetical protein